MIFILLLPVLLAVSGCGDFDGFYEARRSGTKPGPLNGEVLALVGEEEITKGDLEAAIVKLPYNQRRLYESSPGKKAQYLDTIINQKVLYAEALKRGIDRREDIVEKTENFKKRLVGQALAQEILSSLEVREDEIREFYDENKGSFERVSVRKIAINAGTGEAGRSRAEEISARAGAGESWEALAAEYGSGGAPEFVYRGELPPGVEERVFGMEKGEVSGPLEVDGGFLIIKTVKDAHPAPLGEVSRRIESDIINEKLVDYVYGLRDDRGVVIYKDRLEESPDSEQNK